MLERGEIKGRRVFMNDTVIDWGVATGITVARSRATERTRDYQELCIPPNERRLIVSDSDGAWAIAHAPAS